MSETWLESWHTRHAGTAWQVFSEADDVDGQSSYDRLAAVVPDGSDVLDLACGDGGLLWLIRRRASRCRLTGVDLTEAELAAARIRLPSARFVQGRAQSLPFADGSFDVVTSHMALMLMDDAAAVVAEIRRVLRPGGLLAATVGAGGTDGFSRAILQALRALRARLGLPPPPVLGDERFRSPEAIAGLLQGFEGFEHQTVQTALVVPRAGLGAHLAHAYYGHDELPAAEVEAVLAGFDLPDPVAWPSAMCQFSARR